MAKTKGQKVKIIEDLQDKIKKSKSIFLVNYEGLKVSDTQKLKKLLKKETVDYLVAKKTLFKIACEKTKLGIDPKTIEGNFALVFSFTDEVAPAKTLAKFSKENENLKIIAAILGGEFLPADKAAALAKLPSRQELLAKFVGSINAPVYGMVNVLAGNLRGLVQVLNSIKNNK